MESPRGVRWGPQEGPFASLGTTGALPGLLGTCLVVGFEIASKHELLKHLHKLAFLVVSECVPIVS